MGLGQYNSLGEYCGLSTASEVFLILVLLALAKTLPNASPKQAFHMVLVFLGNSLKHYYDQEQLQRRMNSEILTGLLGLLF